VGLSVDSGWTNGQCPQVSSLRNSLRHSFSRSWRASEAWTDTPDFYRKLRGLFDSVASSISSQNNLRPPTDSSPTVRPRLEQLSRVRGADSAVNVRIARRGPGSSGFGAGKLLMRHSIDLIGGCLFDIRCLWSRQTTSYRRKSVIVSFSLLRMIREGRGHVKSRDLDGLREAVL